MSFINWEEAEKYNSWASAKFNNVPGDSWNEGADGWQKRIDFEKEFTREQVDACTRITKDTTVLDACCGTGRTALPFAQKAKHVYAVDGAPNMLMHCKNNADSLGLKNITIEKVENWHTVKPGESFPLVDVAVSVIGPPQADILNFSKFATKYCYFLSFSEDRFMAMIMKLFKGTSNPKEGPLSGRTTPLSGPKDAEISSFLAPTPLKTPSMSQLQVHFNILIEHGVKPEVKYANGAWAYEADSLDEIYDYIRGFGQVDEDKEEIFRENLKLYISKVENGFRFAYESQMYVLGWDPNEIKW